jgi:hypothetical protein
VHDDCSGRQRLRGFGCLTRLTPLETRMQRCCVPVEEDSRGCLSGPAPFGAVDAMRT